MVQIRFCLDLVELRNKFKKELFPTKPEPKKSPLNNLIWRKKNKILPNNPEALHFSEEEKTRVDIIEEANLWVKIIGKIWFGQSHILSFQHMKEFL